MPTLTAFEHLRLELTSGLPDGLFAALAVHNLDLVLSDSPSRYREGLPECLDDGPILMPGFHSNLRRHLLRWYRDQGLEPRVVAEINDSAVLKVFGQRGLGMFAVPTAVEGGRRSPVRGGADHGPGRRQRGVLRYFCGEAHP